MNAKEALSELKQNKDLVFLLATNGNNGRVYGHAPAFAIALNGCNRLPARVAWRVVKSG